MGAMAEHAKKAEAELKVSRAKMERDNHAQMEALAKIVPEPTVETIQRALGHKSSPQPAPSAPAVETRASEPTKQPDKGGYATRASRPGQAAPEQKEKEAAKDAKDQKAAETK